MGIFIFLSKLKALSVLNTWLNKFRLGDEKEELNTVISNVESGIVFRGTNLWILIFAIFVASLGLNVNSTAVIIGAMLISPVMGPIMGIGLSIGINDGTMLRRALSNYLYATVVALLTSTLFFLLSPLDDAHSELLARTSPTIYDVLIALFGGLAGFFAVSSRLKGNVIPGVAIATALMPPLCTAGYGLATLQISFFVGAFYLYVINTVFIALATVIIARILHYPNKKFTDQKTKRFSRQLVWSVVILTLLPSIYFGYDLVQQNRFQKNANRFISNETQFPNDYLLSRKVDFKKRSITLVFGGRQLTDTELQQMRRSLPLYGLGEAELDVKQGFSWLSQEGENKPKQDAEQLSKALVLEQERTVQLRKELDSIQRWESLIPQIYKEIKVQYPGLKRCAIQRVPFINEQAEMSASLLVFVEMDKPILKSFYTRLQNWLKVRLSNDSVQLIVKP